MESVVTCTEGQDGAAGEGGPALTGLEGQYRALVLFKLRNSERGTRHNLHLAKDVEDQGVAPADEHGELTDTHALADRAGRARPSVALFALAQVTHLCRVGWCGWSTGLPSPARVAACQGVWASASQWTRLFSSARRLRSSSHIVSRAPRAAVAHAIVARDHEGGHCQEVQEHHPQTPRPG